MEPSGHLGKVTSLSDAPLATYTLQVFGPTDVPAEEGSADVWLKEDQRVLSNLPAMLEAAEEDLTKLLPEGYRCIIKTWDADDGGPVWD